MDRSSLYKSKHDSEGKSKGRYCVIFVLYVRLLYVALKLLTCRLMVSSGVLMTSETLEKCTSKRFSSPIYCIKVCVCTRNNDLGVNFIKIWKK